MKLMGVESSTSVSKLLVLANNLPGTPLGEVVKILMLTHGICIIEFPSSADTYSLNHHEEAHLLTELSEFCLPENLC